jgi:hypothetical protein
MARTDNFTYTTPDYVAFVAVLSTAVSRDVAADAGFLCDTAAVLGAAIRETL